MPVPLSRAASGRQAAALPDPFPALADGRYQAHLRRGQLVMLAGPPGAGKTMVALVAAIKMGVPTLYISADSDEDVMAARAAAAITGHQVSVVSETIQHGLFSQEYGSTVAALPIRFVFDPSEPSITDIAHAYAAWMEVFGTSPHLIVIDNLMNMRSDSGGDEWAALRQACKDLQYFSRKTRACVLVLHHTSEQDSNHIESAPPRSAIQGKVSQLPAMIFTVANCGGELLLAVVKHRNGPQDPKARNPIRMVADFTNCRIFDQSLNGGIRYGGNSQS